MHNDRTGSYFIFRHFLYHVWRNISPTVRMRKGSACSLLQFFLEKFCCPKDCQALIQVKAKDPVLEDHQIE